MSRGLGDGCVHIRAPVRPPGPVTCSLHAQAWRTGRHIPGCAARDSFLFRVGFLRRHVHHLSNLPVNSRNYPSTCLLTHPSTWASVLLPKHVRSHPLATGHQRTFSWSFMTLQSYFIHRLPTIHPPTLYTQHPPVHPTPTLPCIRLIHPSISPPIYLLTTHSSTHPSAHQRTHSLSTHPTLFLPPLSQPHPDRV